MSYKKFHVPLDIKSKFNDLYEIYVAKAPKEKLDELGIDGQNIFQVMFENDEGVEILLEGLDNKKKQLEFMKTSGILYTEKLVVPNDIASKYTDLYEMYQAEKKLKQDGINDPDDFKGLLSNVQGIHLLLDELNEENKIKFMKTSGIKSYSVGGRNRKRRSKKRRGNRRKSTRRRSRR
jgi:hypothetical protein